MCGRYVSSSTPDAIAEYFGAVFDAQPLEPSYNVAPTNEVYAVVGTPDDTPRLDVFRWGLVPIWAKDTKIGSTMINARAETLAEKPSFKKLFATHRCLVPMDGFYEWKAGTVAAPEDTPVGDEGLTLFTDTPDAPVKPTKKPKAVKPPKQPMFIHRADGDPLAVAGLWTVWRDKALGPDAPWLHTLTVVTTSANTTMSEVHDRMPVIVDKDDWATWLDPENHDVESLGLLLKPASDDVLVMHPVSTGVNNVRNKGAELTDPI